MNLSRSLTQQAFLEFFELIDPRKDKDEAAKLAMVRESITTNGVWNEQNEWRISTWFEVTIKPEEVHGKPWFSVSVECDMQTLSCKCPTLERAFMLSRLYQHIIIYQFYSVGPPWADRRGEP